MFTSYKQNIFLITPQMESNQMHIKNLYFVRKQKKTKGIEIDFNGPLLYFIVLLLNLLLEFIVFFFHVSHFKH